MAIVNIVHPSDDTTFEPIITDLKSYVTKYDTILKVIQKENSKIVETANWVFGFDIIIAIYKSETAIVEYYLNDQQELLLDGILCTKFQEENPNNMATFKIGVPDTDLAMTAVDAIKQHISGILADPLRNEIFRWIRDDIGSWYAIPISQAQLETKCVYDKFGFSNEKYLEAAVKAYKTSKCGIDGRKETPWYLFGKDGYVHFTPGFVPVGNYAMYVLDNLRLADGWVLIDGNWHLFSNRHISESVATIDDQVVYLSKYGKLDEDSALFEIDPNNRFVLHRKGV